MELAALTAFLAPFVPYLLQGGKVVAEEAGKAFGTEAWKHAQALWERLRPSVEDKEAAREAADDLAAQPGDERARGAFELQLEKLLAVDATLRADLESLWGEAKAAKVVVASGERSVAVGDSVVGPIVTGDDNSIG